MKRKHYLLSVEINGIRHYAVRNPACFVGYKLTTDENKAETFGEGIKARWLKQYPGSLVQERAHEHRPDLEELRTVKRQLRAPKRVEKPARVPKAKPVEVPKVEEVARPVEVSKVEELREKEASGAPKLLFTEGQFGLVVDDEKAPAGYFPLLVSFYTGKVDPIPGNIEKSILLLRVREAAGNRPVLPTDQINKYDVLDRHIKSFVDRTWVEMMRNPSSKFYAVYKPYVEQPKVLKAKKLSRRDVLGLMTVAGYEGDQRTFARLLVEHRISRKAGEEAFNKGRLRRQQERV